ncbi:MAG: acid phosphatase [Sphingopyxis sp.]|nr:acid phosphatase [Sphingopyxis sp.]
MRSLALTGALTGALLLAGCAATGTEPVAAFAAVPPAPTNAVPPQFQYLYGSGEGGAVALGVFHSLIAYVTEQAAKRPTDSVVLAADSAMRGASWAPCGDKPLAVVFDVDETLIQNLGFEARAATGEAYDQARWSRWEQSGDKAVAAMPGAVHAVDDLRKLGVTVVFNSNRSSANAAGTVAAIKAAGLGEARHGETLFLKGDDSLGSAKDGRRAIIASRFCVVAMVGDQLGDFSDLFAAVKPVAERRDLAIHSSAAGKWGKGWFIVPNPVYGSALAGDQDAVFPADKRWADPAEEKK